MARTPGEPKTCEIFLSGGKWHASVTILGKPKREHGDGIEAFDLGLERFLTAARLEPEMDEPVIVVTANPRHPRKALDGVRKIERGISRKETAAIPRHGKRKGFRVSKRLRKERQLLAGAHAKVANVRKDFLHKESAEAVGRSAVLIGETLEPKKMTASARGNRSRPGRRVRRKAGLNRGILDASFGAYGKMTGSKAEEAGIRYREAQAGEWKPSQRCHECGRVEKKALRVRWHECQCGASCHRDENSALTLLDWGIRQIGIQGSGTGPAWSGGLWSNGTAAKGGIPRRTPTWTKPAAGKRETHARVA